jgi:hypothetical protein
MGRQNLLVLQGAGTYQQGFCLAAIRFMQDIFCKTILVIILISAPYSEVWSQKYTYSREELDRMVLTYTYYIIQKISLNVISVKYPKLEKKALIASAEWEREYLPSIENIDKKLTDTLKTEWEKNRAFIHYKYEGTDYSTITEANAQKYVDEVFQRAVGKMESPIVETLLIFKPGYLENPEKEYIDGHVNRFSTAKLKKPIGIEIQFFYPKSWMPSPGNVQADCIQNFISQYGLGKLTMAFYVIKSKNDFSTAAIEKLLSEEELKKTLPPNATLIQVIKNLKIDYCRASCVRYWNESSSNGIKSVKYFETYHSYYKNYHIIVNININSENDNKNEIIQKYNLQYKLIRKVINSIVIVSQWDKKRF